MLIDSKKKNWKWRYAPGIKKSVIYFSGKTLRATDCIDISKKSALA